MCNMFSPFGCVKKNSTHPAWDECCHIRGATHFRLETSLTHYKHDRSGYAFAL